MNIKVKNELSLRQFRLNIKMNKKVYIYIYMNTHTHTETQTQTHTYKPCVCTYIIHAYDARNIHIIYEWKDKDKIKKTRKKSNTGRKKNMQRIKKCEPQHLYEPLNRDA